MRKFTVDDWQQRLNALNQPLIIVGKRQEDKRELFEILCCICGNTFDADRKALKTACLLRENGRKTNWCPICNRKRSVAGINDVATVRKDLIKYFDNPEDAKKHSTGSHARVKLRCPECKQAKMLQVCDLCSKGFHCDYCDDNISLGEKIIRNLILQLPVEEYDFEYSDSWTQNKRYDVFFAYQGRRYLIEMDGEQHSKDTSWSTKERQTQNDNLKSELALRNGFELIRIKAYRTDFDYIRQNVLDGRLSDIFDLSDIDWNVICKQTVTSRNLEIAKYYMEHEGAMIKDIAEYFHISYPTAKRTLKRLSDIGLCNYSKEKAFWNGRKQYVENRVRLNTPFFLYSPDNTLMGTFKTAHECFYEFADVLKAIGLDRRRIDYLLYTGKAYKGYRFVYENGLYEYHKNKHPILFEMCDLYNNGLSVKEISLKMNVSTAKAYMNVIAGANIGICNYQERDERRAI